MRLLGAGDGQGGDSITRHRKGAGATTQDQQSTFRLRQGLRAQGEGAGQHPEESQAYLAEATHNFNR